MSTPTPPDYSVKRLADRRDSLIELEHLWDSASVGPLWWDNRRYVWTRRHYRGTYKGLYGKWPALRGWSGLRSGLKKIQSFSPFGRWSSEKFNDIKLPSDVVLKQVHDGFVVASSAQRKVVKLVHSEFARECLQREIDVQGALREAHVEAFVPTVLEHGTTKAGDQWMLSEFVPNTNPLHNPLRPRQSRGQLWHRCLQRRVLPVLERFYASQGVEQRDADEVFEQGLALLKGHPHADVLYDLAQLAREARPPNGEKTFLRTFLHADLRPEHIHRHGDQWWLIDWGMAERGDLVWEFLPWQRRQAQASQRSISHFWAWIRGGKDATSLPKGVRRTLDLYLQWLPQWAGITPSLDAVRYQLLCALLEDIASSTKHLKGDEPLRYDKDLRDHVPYHTWVGTKQLYALRLIEEAPPNEDAKEHAT